MRTIRARLLAAAALTLSLAACGGSKGTAGDGLSVTPAAASFQAKQNGNAPAGQRLDIQITSKDPVYLGYGFDPPTPPGWLSVGPFTGSGSAWSTVVGVTSTSLPPGTYRTTLRIGIGTAERVIAVQNVAITYVVDGVLAVSPRALSFRKVVGGPDPALQPIAVSGGAPWSATATRPWILLGATGGTGPGPLQVGVDPASLDPGTYLGSIVVSRTDRNETEAVDVSLTVEPPAFVTSTATLSFAGVNGGQIYGKRVEVALNSGAAIPWSVAADAAWVLVSQEGATTPATFVVGVDPSVGPLASGRHTAKLTLTGTAGATPLSKTLDVVLDLTRASFTVTPAAVSLGGPDGRDLTARTLRIGLSTGEVEHAWTATAPGWITLGATSGTASTLTPATVAVGVNPALAGPGTHAGSIELTALVNGDTVTTTVPVTVALDTQRLVASDRGVAFASMPGLSRLTRTLKIRDVLGTGVAWTPSADAGWLTVAHGAAAGELVLTADPTGLATGTVHEATVTISPDQAGPTPETIRVGFWVDDVAPPASRKLPVQFTRIEADPIRPYVYVAGGGTDITVYNVYTGAVVRTLARVAPAPLGAMATSTDGESLYVVDGTNLKVVPVELRTSTVGSGWSVGAVSPGRIAFARIDGQDVILGSGHAWDGSSAAAWDASSGAALDPAAPARVAPGALRATSADGSRFCAAGADGSPHAVLCQPLEYSALAGRIFTTTLVNTLSVFGYQGDLALSPDGTRVVHQGEVFDAAFGGAPVQSLTLVGRSYEFTRDGRLVGAVSAWYGSPDTSSPTNDLFVYDASGFSTGYDVAGYAREPLDAQMKVTGDGLCAVVLTNDPRLVFQIIGP